jgi:hypothetical protein
VVASLTGRLIVVLWLLCATGCVAHLQRGPSPAENYRYEPGEELSSHFAYRAPGPVELSEPIDSTRFHELVHLSFTSSGTNGHPDNTVDALYYRSLSPGAKKLVIVMPIWGTSSYPPSRISRGYARRSRGDANIIWVLGETPLFPWNSLSSTVSEQEFITLAKESAERYRAAVVDMRRLIDWAETQPDIDVSRIAMVGFSMSALLTATVMGNEPRISTGVLMMGAANFADVFALCDKRAGEVRQHVLAQHGWSQEQYREFFRELFGPADPIGYPEGRFDPKKILLIDAAFDDCMPRTSRDALWEVTGHPARITLLSRHRSGFYSLTPLGLNFIRRRIYDFLDETL